MQRYFGKSRLRSGTSGETRC